MSDTTYPDNILPDNSLPGCATDNDKMTPETETPHAKPHGFVTRSIHWFAAGLIAYGYAKGLNTVGQLSDPGLFWFEVGFALMLGGLFLVRLLWTSKIAGASRLPGTAPSWEKTASRLCRYGIYASVFGIVLSGLGIAGVYATPFLGGPVMDVMIGLHEASLAALPVLLAVHIAGALWHKFFRRDGVMETMTGRLPI